MDALMRQPGDEPCHHHPDSRLGLRVVSPGGPADCVIEAEVAAHAYEALGVASQRQWQVALTLDHAVAVPI